MKFIDRILFGDGRGTLWFYLVLVPSFLPVVTTLLTALRLDPAPSELRDYVSLNDLVFAGMTLSISSLNILLGDDDRRRKVGILSLAMILTVLLANDLDKAHPHSRTTVHGLVVTIAMVIASIMLSYSASRHAYNNIKR